MIPFNADEIFEIAQQIERNGARFYRLAAQRADSEQTRQLLSGLAEMEIDHEKTFAAIAAEHRQADADPVFVPPDDMDGLGASYLRAVAGGHVFKLDEDPEALMETTASMEDVLRIAIDQEKNSIVFYIGIQREMSLEAGHERINRIVSEELHHLTTLTEYLQMLTDK